MTTNIKEQLEAIPGAALVEFYDATHQKPWPVCAYKREDCNASREFSHGTLVAKPADGWPDIWLWGRIQYRVVVKDAARQMLECMEVHMPRPAKTYTEKPEPVDVPVKDMEIPEEIEIPRFLAPDPLDDVPASLLDLAEPDETPEAMQARMWSLWLELNGKLMLGLATTEETALHSRLHNELHWFAPPIEGE